MPANLNDTSGLAGVDADTSDQSSRTLRGTVMSEPGSAADALTVQARSTGEQWPVPAGQWFGALPSQGDTCLIVVDDVDDAWVSVPGVIPPPSVTPPLVAALPGVPDDGDEIYFAADGTGVVWHLRYHAASASAHKWEVVGGSPLFAENTGAFTTTSAAYGDMAGGAVMPSITLPLAGDYMVTIEATVFQVTGGEGLLSYATGGTAASDTDAIAETSTTTGLQCARTRRRNDIPAGAALAMKGRTTANTLEVVGPSIRAIPVRVG